MLLKSSFKPVKLRLKIDIVSYPARAEWLVNIIKPHPICRQSYKCHACKIREVLIQNMRPTRAQLLLLMSTWDDPNDSVIPTTRSNQREPGQNNMEDEAIFPNRVPLRDLQSIVLPKDEHYSDGGWFFFCFQSM